MVDRVEDSELVLRVVSAAPAADLVRDLVLVRDDGGALPGFSPGSHLLLRLPDGDSRAYSLVDLDGTAAAPARYRLGVRLEVAGGGGSRHVHGLAPGDRVTVTGPVNQFPLHDGPGPALLVAGGIGVTPIASMATALRAAGRPYRLVYAVRDAGALAFGADLRALHGDALTVHLDSDAGGPLPLAPLIDAAAPDCHLYVCGPRPMIEAARDLAAAAGFGPDRIHFELFEAAAPEADDTAFEVEIASTGQVFAVPPGRSIIEVLEQGGVDLVYDCQRGDCGICQVGVLDGVPDHRDVVLTQAERAAGKLMQICVSRALSPRLKLDL